MLQQMFEVTATCFHAATQTFVPLINSVIDDTLLLQTGPLVKATRQRALGVTAHRLKYVREKGKNNIAP